MQTRADVMYVLMFTCMCVAADYRKEGLQTTRESCNEIVLTIDDYKRKLSLNPSGQ